MVTLLDEVIAKHFQVGLGIFRIFNILKGTIHFLFARRTFLTKEVVVSHFPEMRRWCTHMFTNNLRKRDVVSNALYQKFHNHRDRWCRRWGLLQDT